MARKTKVPRGLYQRENGMWYCRIAGLDGNLIRKPLSMDRDTAIVLLNEMRKQIELQKAGILPTVIEREYKTFAELKEAYIKHLKARAVSEGTIAAFENTYKRVILGNRFVYLHDMTLGKVEDWARGVAGELAGQTINYYVKQIKCVLQWAHSNSHIRKNVLANWVSVRNNEPRYRRDFTAEEVEKLFEAEDDPIWRLRWLVYFHTALRSTAGRNICWEWIDWESKQIRLPLEHNKSRRVHEIPMSNILSDALAARKAELGNPSGAIFPSITSNTVRRRLQRACTKAEIDMRGLCPHSIRHTVATAAYEATGRDLTAVQELLGHTNIAVTSTYLHVTYEKKRQAVASFGFGTKREVPQSKTGEISSGVSVTA